MTDATPLPPNSTALERALTQLEAERMGALEVNLQALWDPALCPAELLPWLAWAESLDMWQEAWTEQQKRAAIAASQDVHERKGTPAAVERGLTALGYAFTLKEWFQETPKGTPGTFTVDIEITDQAVNAELLAQLVDVIHSTKNTRSHLATLVSTMKSQGAVHIAAGSMFGSLTEIWPDEFVNGFSAANALHDLIENQLFTAVGSLA